MSEQLSPQQIEARRLVEAVLKDADWLLPELVTLLAKDIIVPSDPDGDVDRLTVFLQRTSAMVTNVLNLRMLSLTERPTS